eukprot:4331203-Pyramimonas_sp.AAC.1
MPNNVMGSRTLHAELPLTRLGSGHRMATIAQPLLDPEARPQESALKKYPFLTEDSFRLRSNAAPEMLDSGEVRECVLPFLIIITPRHQHHVGMRAAQDWSRVSKGALGPWEPLLGEGPESPEEGTDELRA